MSTLSTKKKIVIAVAAFLAAVVAIALYELLRARESIYVGIIEFTKVYVSQRVSSQVKARLIDEGMMVEEGDVLYELACEDIGVDKYKLSRDYARAEKMLAGGTMSPQDYDRVKAEHDDNAYRWEWCTVRAPLHSVVLTKYSEPGEWVSPGVKMMSLGDVTDVWAYVYVAQPMIANLSLGQNVTGYLPEIDKKVPGWIIKINEEAEFTPKNAQTRKERTRLVFGVKIKFDNSENILKPGMPIEVTF